MRFFDGYSGRGCFRWSSASERLRHGLEVGIGFQEPLGEVEG